MSKIASGKGSSSKVLRKRQGAALALGGVALVLVSVGMSLFLSGDEGVTANDARLAEGARLYAAHCAACHGADLEGQPNWRQRGPDGMLPAPPHDASGHTWHHSGRHLFAITKYGTEALVGGDYRSQMRGFADELSDDEIWAVLGYIQSRWPEDIRRRQQEITARDQ